MEGGRATLVERGGRLAREANPAVVAPRAATECGRIPDRVMNER